MGAPNDFNLFKHDFKKGKKIESAKEWKNRRAYTAEEW
jgi:hypothetical protein